MTVFDRWGGYRCELTDIIAATWSQEVNSLDTLELETRQELSKGDRVVWRDSRGLWHEHIVTSTEVTHDAAGAATITAHAENSLCEVRWAYIEDLRPGVSGGGVGAATAIKSALTGTRWEVGTVDVGTVTGASLYHVSAWDALSTVVDTWGGELQTTITVDPSTGVTGRAVDLLTRVGSDAVTRRFAWSRDLSEVTRTVDDEDVITACYAWGKGEELDEGTYGRRIGISDVTADGLPYVHDDTALELWGVPDASGTRCHVFGELVDADIDDAATLMAEAEAYLAEHCTPKVSYTASVVQFGEAGTDLTGVVLGDSVQVVDEGFPGGLRVEARVMGLETDLLQPDNPTVTLDNFAGGLGDLYGSLSSSVSNLSDRSASWDAVQSASAGYIDAVIAAANQLFASGGSYLSFSVETGLLVMDAETYEAATMAINITGAGLRIADSKTSTGWDWRTFGTGAGFTSDLIIAGTLKAGRIEDVTGDNYWDLDTGEVHIGSFATDEDIAAAVDLSAGQILASVSETYLTTADAASTYLTDGDAASTYATVASVTEVSSNVAQTADALTVSISQKSSEISALQSSVGDLSSEVGDTSSRVSDIEAYVRVGTDSSGNAALDLGSTASDMTVQLTNEQLSFMDSGAVVAYINGQKLYITSAEILDTLTIGDYAWVPGNGTMELKYIG